MSEKRERLYLIDISSFIFRAFYAVRPLTAPSGLPTNAIYGVLSMLLKLLKDYKPQHVVICYDRKEPSFRKEIYDDYKANRSEMPEDLVPQMSVIKNLIDLMGLPSLEVAGFEADDLIGTMAKIARQKYDMEVYVVSGDKDFAQIVDDSVFLVDTMKDSKIGPPGVLEKWGVRPDQFIDYLALVGDSSDNIPGVAGIGPKGAKDLLGQFEDLDGIYKNLDQIKSASLKGKLENGRDSAKLSKKLVTISCDVSVSDNMNDYRLKELKAEPLRELLKELNFKSFEKSIFEDKILQQPAKLESAGTQAEVVAAPEPAKKVDEVEVKTLSSAQLAQQFPKNSEVWFWFSEHGLYFSNGKEIFQTEVPSDEVGKISSDLGWSWCGHDLKKLWHFLKPVNPRAGWDSMLAAYVIKPGEKMEFSHVHSWILGRILSDLPTVSELMQSQYELRETLTQKMKESDVEKVYLGLEIPLVSILYKMESLGICLDVDFLSKEGHDLGAEIKQLELKIHELAGEEFNIGSPKQLSPILFEKLNLTKGKKLKSGIYSTDSDVLESIRTEHPIVEELLKYRELTKLKSTYVDSLPTLVAADGRIHTTFSQAATMTGRLSSIDPNLQNIPIKTERGARVRRAFVAEKTKVLLSVDYSQIELRILAHYSSDPNLIRAFEEDLDIHAITASEVFGVALKEVKSDMRRTAKAVNFGIAYGQGAFGLAETLGIPRGQAQDIIKKYFAKFVGVKEYIENTVVIAKEQGYVETLFGRKRYMDELKSNNPMLRKFGERAAINAPIQGSASDIVKKAMVEINEKIPVSMLLQVHDELIFEGEPDQVEKWRPQIVQIMEKVTALKVPLKANSSVGKSWEAAH